LTVKEKNKEKLIFETLDFEELIITFLYAHLWRDLSW